MWMNQLATVMNDDDDDVDEMVEVICLRAS